MEGLRRCNGSSVGEMRDTSPAQTTLGRRPFGALNVEPVNNPSFFRALACPGSIEGHSRLCLSPANQSHSHLRPSDLHQMAHADASLVPSTITTKSQFWDHVYSQLESLLEGQRHWITNLANASSLIYNCLLAFPAYFGSGDRAVNWCGFYILPSLFPHPQFTTPTSSQPSVSRDKGNLLLGPFCGKPACQLINLQADKARGVCADAFIHGKTVIVRDVNTYPGHIACDGSTNSEIVCPLIYQGSDGPFVFGVLDLDCLALSGFDEDDQAGLEQIAKLIVRSCEW